MIKNKKAAIFLTFVSFSLIIAYIFFITTFNSDAAESQPKDFTKQAEILETYQQGEKILLYIDLSAKYSAYKTIHNLAKNGGSFNDLGCGKYNDFLLWNSEDKECFPLKKSLYQTFSKDFNLNLDEYLKKYEEPRLLLDKIMIQNQKQEIPLNNYDLLFKDKQLIGIATQNLAINKNNINYSIKPSFNISLDYDLFQDYEYLVEKAKEIIDSCSEEPENLNEGEGNKDIKDNDVSDSGESKIPEKDENEEIDSCIENLINGEEGFKWSVEKENNFFMFSVERNKVLPVYNSKAKKVFEQPIVYKFALYLGQTSEINQ